MGHLPSAGGTGACTRVLLCTRLPSVPEGCTQGTAQILVKRGMVARLNGRVEEWPLTCCRFQGQRALWRSSPSTRPARLNWASRRRPSDN